MNASLLLGHYPTGWELFWEIALIASGVVFAAITVIVAVRGGAELIRMFRGRVRK